MDPSVTKTRRTTVDVRDRPGDYEVSVSTPGEGDTRRWSPLRKVLVSPGETGVGGRIRDWGRDGPTPPLRSDGPVRGWFSDCHLLLPVFLFLFLLTEKNGTQEELTNRQCRTGIYLYIFITLCHVTNYRVHDCSGPKFRRKFGLRNERLIHSNPLTVVERHRVEE